MSRSDLVGSLDRAPGDLDRAEDLGAPVRPVIEGRVLRGGATHSGAQVRLLDHNGEFTAEVVSDPHGHFRFVAAPGLWTVRALTAGARAARTVQVTGGRVEVDLPLSPLPPLRAD